MRTTGSPRRRVVAHAACARGRARAAAAAVKQLLTVKAVNTEH